MLENAQNYLQNSPPGSTLLGAISYGKLSFASQEGGNPQKNPVSYQVAYLVPPNKVVKMLDYVDCLFICDPNNAIHPSTLPFLIIDVTMNDW